MWSSNRGVLLLDHFRPHRLRANDRHQSDKERATSRQVEVLRKKTEKQYDMHVGLHATFAVGSHQQFRCAPSSPKFCRLRGDGETEHLLLADNSSSKRSVFRRVVESIDQIKLLSVYGTQPAGQPHPHQRPFQSCAKPYGGEQNSYVRGEHLALLSCEGNATDSSSVLLS